jgi:hypothetical protein
MEALQEGPMMDIPANGGVRADIVIGTPYIYTFAFGLVFLALVASAFLSFNI